jgi:hypothetical protein
MRSSHCSPDVMADIPASARFTEKANRVARQVLTADGFHVEAATRSATPTRSSAEVVTRTEGAGVRPGTRSRSPSSADRCGCLDAAPPTHTLRKARRRFERRRARAAIAHPGSELDRQERNQLSQPNFLAEASSQTSRGSGRSAARCHDCSFSSVVSPRFSMVQCRHWLPGSSKGTKLCGR